MTFRYQVLSNKDIELKKGIASLIELEEILPIELHTVVTAFCDSPSLKIILEFDDMKYSVIKVQETDK